ncbi:MAG: hypothetical protein FWC39_07955 [Bacteroidetes bacterium]|nr:hypothetical protein [Bacteroidota bacterium]
MKSFEVNWDKFNAQLSPILLRKKLLFAFLKATTAPLWTIYRYFIANRTETIFILRYDTSKGNLERALNIRFETGTAIYVVNSDVYIDETVYLSETEIVHIPFYLGAITDLTSIKRQYIDDTLYLDFYIDAKTVIDDFIIMVPLAVDAVFHDEIVRFAQLFTLPGFRFRIQTY